MADITIESTTEAIVPVTRAQLTISGPVRSECPERLRDELSAAHLHINRLAARCLELDRHLTSAHQRIAELEFGRK